MLKKLSTIFLSVLCLASLCVGIMFSACPVIPYVTYYSDEYYSNFKKKEEIEDNPWLEGKPAYKMESYSTRTFSPNGTLKTYWFTLGRYDDPKDAVGKLTSIRTYIYNDIENILLIEIPTEMPWPYKISDNKKELSDEASNKEYKAKFNPTFIFYLVSAGALAGIIAINIPKKKKDE